MRALLPSLPLLVSSALAGCAPCDPPAESAPDYASDDDWICRPGKDGDVCAEDLRAAEVSADGSVAIVEHVAAEDPEAACFWVYPTVDLALRTDVHRDLDDRAAPEAAVRGQGARLTEVCSVHAPAYRQAKLGTYAERDIALRDRCFEIAVGDVLGAFEQFLSDIGERPFLIAGHSQGAQMTTEILRRRVEDDDALTARMVAALPIGWAVGTASGEDRTGGTFERVPTCASADETGCVVAYRTFGAGARLPNDPTVDGREGLFFGESVACTNPVDDGATLSRAYFPVGSLVVEIPDAAKESGAPFALFRDAYTAQCVREGANAALQIAPVDGIAQPVDFSAGIFTGATGLHLIDVSLTQGDLVDLAGRKIARFLAQGEAPQP